MSQRLAQIEAAAKAKSARFFVWTEPDATRDYDDPKLARELRTRTARPNGETFPAGDLCQQAPLADAPTVDLDSTETAGTLSFERRGSWSAAGFAREYQLWIGGYEVLVTDDLGLHRMPPGDHQVWMVRESGVGPVMVVTEHEGIRNLRDEADACIRDALTAGPDALAVHFRRLAERLPEAELYVALGTDRVRDLQVVRWDGERLVEVPD